MNLFFQFFSAWAALTWSKLAGYRTLTTPDEMEYRFSKCSPCKFYRDGVCAACGCLVVSKIMLTSEKCPKSFWSRVWVKRVTVTS